MSMQRVFRKIIESLIFSMIFIVLMKLINVIGDRIDINLSIVVLLVPSVVVLTVIRLFEKQIQIDKKRLLLDFLFVLISTMIVVNFLFFCDKMYVGIWLSYGIIFFSFFVILVIVDIGAKGLVKLIKRLASK